jgi:hypothetical protein
VPCDNESCLGLLHYKIRGEEYEVIPLFQNRRVVFILGRLEKAARVSGLVADFGKMVQLH